MENVIDATHRGRDGVRISHIADVELQFAVVVKLPHVVLLLFVAGEDTDLTDVGIEETAQDSITERAGSASNQKCFIFFKHKKTPRISISIKFEII